MRVWREKNGWQGPYKILIIDGHNIILNIINGPIIFRFTVIRFYYRDLNKTDYETDAIIESPRKTRIKAPQPRRRGRPAGLKNKLKAAVSFTAFIARKK